MPTESQAPVKPYLDTSADETIVLVYAGPTEVHSFEAHNPNSEDMWLHIWDAPDDGDVSLGVTAPKQSFLIPAGDGTLYGANARDFVAPIGLATGFCYAVSADPDGGAGPGTDLVVNFTYHARHE